MVPGTEQQLFAKDYELGLNVHQRELSRDRDRKREPCYGNSRESDKQCCYSKVSGLVLQGTQCTMITVVMSTVEGWHVCPPQPILVTHDNSI